LSRFYEYNFVIDDWNETKTKMRRLGDRDTRERDANDVDRDGNRLIGVHM